MVKTPVPSRKSLILSGCIILGIVGVISYLFWMQVSGGFGK